MCPEDTGRAARRAGSTRMGTLCGGPGGGVAGHVSPGPRRRLAWEPAPDGSEHGYERVGAHTNMHAIGVDIGGTKIAAGVVDEDGTILAQTRRDTSPDDVAGIDQAIAEVYPELSGVLRGRRHRASPPPGSSPPTGPPCSSRRTSRGATTRCGRTVAGDPRRRRRADRRRERRQRGRLGRVPVRCGARRRRHAHAHGRHRPRRRDRVQRASSCAARGASPPRSGTCAWSPAGTTAAAGTRAAGSSTPRAARWCATRRPP